MVNVSSEVQHREVSSGILKKKKNQFNKAFIVAAEIIITVATKTHIPPVLCINVWEKVYFSIRCGDNEAVKSLTSEKS